MKVITINAQITRNPRQYEAVRLGMEASIETGENAEDAIKELTNRLNALYEEMYVAPKNVAPKDESKPAETSAGPAQKEVLTIGSRKLQLIVGRIEKAKGDKKAIGEIMANVEKYYTLDEGARKAIDLATKLN